MQEYIEQYKTVVFQKYAEFSGRASRKEFWMFVLVNILISIVISLLRVQILSTLYSLAVFIPSVAVGIRRLHDTNRSGWYLLLGLIPVVGQIILIIFFAQPTKGASVAQAPHIETPPVETPPAQTPPTV